MISKPIVIGNAVIIPAMAIVTIQIPTFHLKTLDPSRFPIGNRLNTAKKLLIEYPKAHIWYINNEVCEVNADRYTKVATIKNNAAKTEELSLCPYECNREGQPLSQWAADLDG